MEERGEGHADTGAPGFSRTSLVEALLGRRARRFGLGMTMPGGPLKFQSRHKAVPLSEDEEAALVFAACGITGFALADLCYERDGGGSIMGGLVGRTIASGDGLQTVALVVINDEASYLIRRPRELPQGAMPEMIAMAHQGAFTELYRRSRVRINTGRVAPPKEPLFNINANRWSAHATGSTCFLPVNDLTLMYINGMLEIFNEHTRAFVVDERNDFQPAGLGRFARGRGGHLEGNPHEGRVATIRQVEQFVTEFVTLEQGMMLQNLGLMAEALGLGGFPNFANHEFGWFQALGFRLEKMRASRYLGAGWLASAFMKLLKRDPLVPYPVGLERDGKALLKAFCPPYFKSMTDAVHAVVEMKFGSGGMYRNEGQGVAWIKGAEVTKEVAPISDETIAATVAYCEYIWERYGRFPATMAPYRTGLAFQACHLDAEFYDTFYKADALSKRQREDFKRRTG